MSQLPPFGNSYANLDVDTLASGIRALEYLQGEYNDTTSTGRNCWAGLLDSPKQS